MALSKISNDVIALSFTVTNVGTTVATNATGSYTIPSGAVWVLGTAFSSQSSTGSRIAVNVKNSGGTTLYTYALSGDNENNGTSGNGVGMSARSGWIVSIPSEAAGGTLEFFRQAGSNATYNVTVNQVVTI
jgi:uncharacterized repeat protein (TIGR01451 family)